MQRCCRPFRVADEHGFGDLQVEADLRQIRLLHESQHLFFEVVLSQLTAGDVDADAERATIQQAMLLANNERLEALFASSDNEPGTKSAVPLESAVAVKEVFQRILIRDADTEELARAVAFLEQRRDRPAAALAQLRWALVAGPEFLINR